MVNKFTQTGRLGIRLLHPSRIRVRSTLTADIQANNKGKLSHGNLVTNPNNNVPLLTKNWIIGSRKRFSVNNRCSSSNNNNIHSSNSSTNCSPMAAKVTIWITRTSKTTRNIQISISIRRAPRRLPHRRATTMSDWTSIWSRIQLVQRPIF